MYLTEEYNMYKIASRLVSEENYEVLHINTEAKELWLEKYENKTSKVVRIIHRGFDWKNHLKGDIAQVFKRTKALEKALLGKTIKIYNIYLSSHSPVDDWSDLKKPLQLKEKNPLKMKVFYMSEANIAEELKRLEEDLAISNALFDPTVLKTESEMEVSIKQKQQKLSDSLYNKQKQREQMFSYGKSRVTYILIALNILMFFLLELSGGSTNTEVLIKYGAKYNPAIMDGEWWRIISSAFLHIGALHLFMNMLALYYLGVVVERIFGSWRFLIIYLFAGIGGGLTSFAFTMNVSAGASGAIFGLFGALLFFGTVHKQVFLQTMGRSILTVVGINLVIGFLIPNIDMGAHLGGLVTGFLASAIVHLPKNKNVKTQLLSFLVYVLLLFGLFSYGTKATNNNANYQVVLVEEAIIKEEFDDVIELTTDALKKDSEHDAIFLFQRAYAYIFLGDVSAAIKDLEHSIEIEEDYEEAYYNLTLLYIEQGDDEKAIEAVEKVFELNPDNDDYANLYEKVTGEKID